jgi:hypothetical protein
LILRREESTQPGVEDRIRGEFILSDKSHLDDFGIVQSLRAVLPLKPCEHMDRGENYETVREVVRVIAEKYSDPDLDLARVAKELPMSPVHLSKILNQQVGVRSVLRRPNACWRHAVIALSRLPLRLDSPIHTISLVVSGSLPA